MKSIQPFDWNQLTKNTWDDMRDDGFKPSSHSPIIDHEVQNDIDELMNLAPVAESDNWVPVNHFYNFDDEDDIDLDIDIDDLISSTLPSEENDAWTPPLHKNFGDDSEYIDSNSDIDTLVSNTLPADENDDWELPPHENISTEDDNTENLSTDIPKVFDDLLQKKSESENIGKSAGKVDIINSNDLSNDYYAAQYFLEIFDFMYCNEDLRIFKHPAYRLLSQNELIATLKEVAPAELKDRSVPFWRKVVEQLKTTASIQQSLDELDYPNDLVVFQNGCYDITLKEFRKATPEDKFINYNDITYNPDNADNNHVTKAFFNQISGGDKDLLRVLWSVIGAILAPNACFKKFFYLYGKPDTGKSVFGSLCEHLVGINNCSHISLEQFSNSKYSSARLYNKMLNTSLDNSSSVLKNLGDLKRFTSGGKDYLETEVKYGKFHKLRPDHIKLLFASNSLPLVSSKEDPKSIRNRILIVPFMNTVPAEERNENLLQELLLEKDYIIKKGLSAYRKLVDNNFVFPTCSACEELLNKSFGVVNTAAIDSFLKSDYCLLGDEYISRGDEIYSVFLDFCMNNNYPVIPRNSFISRLKEYTNITPVRRPMDNKTVRMLQGIAINDEMV